MKVKILIYSLLTIVFAFFIFVNGVDAATLEFDPTSESAAVDEEFILDVMIDAGSDQVLASDARIIYDEQLLSVVEIADGEYFTVAKKDFSTPGTIYIAAIVQNPAEAKTGSGVIASITFKGLQNGTGTVSFVCTPGETARDSNIAKDDIDATDIIECSANVDADVVIGDGTGGGGTAVTPTGTTSGTGSSTTTPSTLPKSGMLEDLLAIAIPGFALVFLGMGMKILLRRM